MGREVEKRHSSGVAPQENNIAKTKNSKDMNSIEYRGDGIEIETSFEISLKNKFSLFKSLITRVLFEANPVLSVK